MRKARGKAAGLFPIPHRQPSTVNRPPSTVNRQPLTSTRLRVFLLRHVPLVAALQTFAIPAARFRELHLRAEVAAFRTLLGDRLVPDDEIAALVRACIERSATLARAPLHELSAILRAEDARGHRPRAAALREGAAAEELTASPLTNHHRRATEMTLVLRHDRLRALALERARVLALLRMVLAREERTEESAARLQLAAAIGTAKVRHFGQ